MESIGKDIRFSVRALRKNPGYTILAVLALALGIGANTAIFSIVYSLMFRPLQGAQNARELTTLVLTEQGSFPYSPSYQAFPGLSYRIKVCVHRCCCLHYYKRADTSRKRQPGTHHVHDGDGNYFDTLGVQMATAGPLAARKRSEWAREM